MTFNGKTPLYLAAQKGHVEVVEKLLKNADVNVNLGQNNGYTPLYIAAENGHGKIVDLLLKHQDINVKKACKDGYTPLHVAKLQGHEESVARLVRHMKRPLDEDQTCLVCLDRTADVFLVPCGHQNLCGPCAYQIKEDSKRCPTDRSDMLEIVPLRYVEPKRKKRRM